MIEIYDDIQSNVLELKLSGIVTAKDYEEVLIPAIEKKVQNNNKIRVLYHVTEDFKSYDFGAMVDDAKAGLMFFNSWEKIVVVSDVQWINNGVKIFSFTVPGEIKVFSNDELKVAKDWLYKHNVNLEVSFDEKDKIITLAPNAALSKDDFENAKKILDPLIEKYDTLNGLIIYTEDFPGWDSFGALIHHLEFIKDHHKHIKKLAFVTDSFVGEIAEKVGSHFVSAKVRNFDFNDLKSAKEWILNDS